MNSIQALFREPRQLNAIERLMLESGSDTSPQFNRSTGETAFSGYLNELTGVGTPREELGSTMRLNPKQQQAYQSTQREVFNNARKFAMVGALPEYEEYVENEGPSTFQTLTEPIFDMLQIGQYTVAGAVQEFLRTDSTWEAFKQAGTEFANALPGIERAEARRPSFGDILRDHGPEIIKGRWESAVGGFILDVLLDPVTYIPGGALLKGASWGAKGSTKLPLVGKGIGRVAKGAEGALQPVTKGLKKHFVYDAELKDLGEAGQKIIDARQLGDHEYFEQLEDIRDTAFKITAGTNEFERRLISVFLQDKKLLDDQLEALSNAGVIDKARVPILKEKRDVLEDEFRVLFEQEYKEGIISHLHWKEHYIAGMGPTTRKSSRNVEKLIRDRGLEPSKVKDSTGWFGLGDESFTKEKTYGTLQARIEAALPTELDYGQVYMKRGIQHARAMSNKRLLNAALDDPNLAMKVPLADVVDGAKRKLIVADAKKGGRELFELKDSADTVTVAYVMPSEIKEALMNGENFLGKEGFLYDALRGAHKMTGFWKGMAVLSPGFHARNMYSNWFLLGMAGVGKAQGKTTAGRVLEEIPEFVKKVLPESEFTGVQMGGLTTRIFQALKLQLGEAGATAARRSETPNWAVKGLQKMFKVDNLDDVKVPEIRWLEGTRKGEVMTSAEIMEEAKRRGVLNRGLFGGDLPEDLEKRMMREVEARGEVPVEMVTGAPGVAPITEQIAAVSGGKRPLLDTLNETIGPGSKILQANRTIGTIVENNSRMALFLDRLTKGASLEEAATSVNKWLFDYTALTRTEKDVMKLMIPFYAWQRFNIPLMLNAIIERPGRFAKVPKLIEMIENVTPEWENIPTPDYFQEIAAVQLPWLRNDKPVFINPNLPFQDLNRMNPQDLLSSLTPFAKLVIEQIPQHGYSTFMERPLEEYTGEMSEYIPGISKRREHAVMTAVPPVGKAVRMVKGVKRKELFEQLMTEGLGIKLVAADTRRTLRGNTYQLRRWSREFKQKLRDEGRWPEGL